MAAPREVPVEQRERQRIARDQLQMTEVAFEFRHPREAAYDINGQLAGWHGPLRDD